MQKIIAHINHPSNTTDSTDETLQVCFEIVQQKISARNDAANFYRQ